MTDTVPDVVILCGGRGRRLGVLTAATPKPLVPVGGKPLIYWSLEQLDRVNVRRVVVVGSYREAQLIGGLASYRWRSAAPEMVWASQAHPDAEGALLTGLDRVESGRAMVLCGDDVLAVTTFRQLIDAAGCGAVMTRPVLNTSLPRVTTDASQRINGTSRDDHLPIMTYNVCLEVDILREWTECAIHSQTPLVAEIEKFLPAEIYAVDGSTSVGVNFPRDIEPVARQLARWRG